MNPHPQGWLTVLLILGAVGLPSSPLAGQNQEAIDTISVLDGVYTEAQAGDGDDLYAAECAACHAPTEFSGRLFELAWADRPVYDLYQVIANTMPQDRPGDLQEEEYAAIVAYILELNEYPAGERELSSQQDTLSAVIIEPPPEDGDENGGP